MPDGNKRNVKVTIKSNGSELNREISVEEKKGSSGKPLKPGKVTKPRHNVLDAKKAAKKRKSKVKKTTPRVRCPICGASIRQSRQDTHIAGCKARKDEQIRLAELRKQQKQRAAEKRETNPTSARGKTKHREGYTASTPRAIQLHTSRGQKNEGVFSCSICRKKVTQTWHFTQTSMGEVDLCLDCKNGAAKPKKKSRKRGYMTRLPGSFGSGKS